VQSRFFFYFYLLVKKKLGKSFKVEEFLKFLQSLLNLKGLDYKGKVPDSKYYENWDKKKST
jgi:hypothetical protein